MFCGLPLQWVETFFRVAQVPFPDKVVLVAHGGKVLDVTYQMSLD